jgi:hypothetical protein
MQEPICSVPWHCGNSDGCKVGWHKATYWVDDSEKTGYTVDNYTDGDHEAAGAGDLPSAEQEVEAWNAYYRSVAETGLDPLAEFRLPAQRRVSRKWQASVRNWIGSTEHGLRVIGVRRRGRGPWLNPLEAPVDVRDFLFLGHPAYTFGGDLIGCKSSLGPELATFEQLKETATNCTLSVRKVLGHIQAVLSFSVDEAPSPWHADRSKAWLKRKAKEALR